MQPLLRAHEMNDFWNMFDELSWPYEAYVKAQLLSCVLSWHAYLYYSYTDPIFIYLHTIIKCNYTNEPYLVLVSKCKYERAIAQSRPHILDIERERHTKPKKDMTTFTLDIAIILIISSIK